MKINVDSDPVAYQKMRDYIILLDPGHYIGCPGKHSPDNTLQEPVYVRQIVKRLMAKLAKTGFDVRNITPEDDVDVSLPTRASRANQIADVNNHKKCILISCHTDGFGAGDHWEKPSGYTCYVAHNCSHKSEVLAATIYKHALKHNLKGDRVIPPEGYRRAGYYILRKTNMPAVLVEELFHTNKENVDFMLTDEGRNTLVQVLYDAIVEYVMNN